MKQNSRIMCFMAHVVGAAMALGAGRTLAAMQKAACSGSYRPAGRGGVLVQPTVGQFDAKPRRSNWHATTDSP